jgi:hypothetical protein
LGPHHRPSAADPYALLREQLRHDYPDLPLSTIEHALDSAWRAAASLGADSGADRHLALFARDRLDMARARARTAVATVRRGRNAVSV